MRALFPPLTLALTLMACHQGCDAPDAGGDAPSACPSTPSEPWRVEAATRSPDGEGWCCQPGMPTCDCGYFGAFVTDRCTCGDREAGGLFGPYGYCDLAPPDWILETDEHGCSSYRARSPTTACCNCPPDAG